jgi:hypothetical protein
MMALNRIIPLILVQDKIEPKHNYYYLKGTILMTKIEDDVLLYFFTLVKLLGKIMSLER